MNTNELNAFIEQQGPRRVSVFAPYESEIRYLREKKATLAAVMQWLAAPPRGVQASQQELSKWLIRKNAAAVGKPVTEAQERQAGKPGVGGQVAHPAVQARIPGVIPGVHVKQAEAAISAPAPAAPLPVTHAPHREAWERSTDKGDAAALLEAAEKFTRSQRIVQKRTTAEAKG